MSNDMRKLITIKWRLFDGRRQLRRSLQPLAQELLPSERPQRKEPAMDSPDLVEMTIEFVGRGLTTNDPERLVMLREPSSGQRLPLHMLAAEGDAIVQHLASLPGAKVRATIEIDAEIPDGAPEHVVRTVTENSRTLKFGSSGFEEE